MSVQRRYYCNFAYSALACFKMGMSGLPSFHSILSPAYDFLATLPYLPHDRLALNFGDSRSLNEITVDQVRRFADTARMPVSSLWQIVTETAERTAAAWQTLELTALLPHDMRTAIGNQILSVATNIRRNRPSAPA